MLQILTGDALEQLKTLPSQSVNMCVTSPPYYGLRDYGTAKWRGGDAECNHRQPLGGEGATSAKQNTSAGTQTHQYRAVCGKCGATRTDNQIGLESSPDAYIARLVDVFREVRRVLRDDGTLWVNIGDSYARAGGYSNNNGLDGVSREECQRARTNAPNGTASQKLARGLKEKDLIGIPWMLAFALRADGWYLRQDIIWAKPNPMPESVTDRCTKSHEYLFLLSKSRQYYYDADAVREPDCKPDGWAHIGESKLFNTGPDLTGGVAGMGGNHQTSNGLHRQKGGVYHPDGRNKRSVWNIATNPYSDAHFATFPPKLIEPCILAGCPEGGTVLDCFAGSGTSGMVALKLARKALLIELNPEYVKLIEQRCRVTPGLQFA